MEQPNKIIEKVIIENKNKAFFNMDWKEMIAFQIFEGKKAYVQHLPHACQAKENDEWLQKNCTPLNMQF